MGEAIAITSGKGGVGKSNITLHLGATLAKKGYQVVLVDMDFGLKNLDVMMGLENRVIYDLVDVMKGNATLSQALIKDKHVENLSLLPACKSIHIEAIKTSSIKKLIQHLKEQYDYILMDSAAGLESGFQCSIACCDRVIVVSTLDHTALQDADRVIGVVLKEGVTKIQLVLNKVNPRYIERNISVSIKEALSYLAIDLLGVVYEDESVIRSNNKGTLSLYEGSMLKECFQVMGNRFVGERCELPRYKGKTLLQRVFG